MKSFHNKVKRIEQNIRPIARQFVCWAGNPWTPEQEAEAIRRHPERRIFWHSLLAGTPILDTVHPSRGAMESGADVAS